MTPEQRQRASLAVRARMNELRLTVPELAARAGIDPGTARALLAGDRWPHTSTRRQLDQALGWKPGELVRRAEARPELSEFTSLELLRELYRREQRIEQRR